LEKRAETVIAKSSIISDKSVLEPAHSIGLVSPNKRKIYFTNIGISLVIAFFLVLIRQIFFNTIKNKDDLEAMSSVPIIGVVTRSKLAKENPIIADSHPKSQTAEAFRSIRTSLDYMASNIDQKVILITSCLASEGKTFCSINLATLIAKAGKKVLLIDLDLHKPRVGAPFDISHNYGVTSYLVGQRSFDEIVNETHIDNLQAISSGSIPPNASDLIMSTELDKLIEEAKKSYEYIILDTPPVGLLSDAVVLVKKADINIYVLKAGFAKKSFCENCP